MHLHDVTRDSDRFARGLCFGVCPDVSDIAVQYLEKTGIARDMYKPVIITERAILGIERVLYSELDVWGVL